MGGRGGELLQDARAVVRGHLAEYPAELGGLGASDDAQLAFGAQIGEHRVLATVTSFKKPGDHEGYSRRQRTPAPRLPFLARDFVAACPSSETYSSTSSPAAVRRMATSFAGVHSLTS